VDFTVDLDPKTVAYWLLDYNVVGVELYRRKAGELEFTPWKFMDLIQTYRATYRWTPVADDAGNYEFAALVKTRIEVPLLEVAKDSVKELEVSCFGPQPLAGAPAARARAQAAPADGARVGPQALTCVDQWVGTATYIAKTPGLPGANITSRSSVTWTFDRTEGGIFQIYKPSGSFDLALNDPFGCTIELSPNTFTIVDDPLTPAKLMLIDDKFNPPTYGIGGAQLVNTTATATCPGKDPVVTEMRGFLVVYASGSGPHAPDQTRLFGSTDDAATTSIWDFSRP
jgi:hypothetical protein